jgi:DNA (cytosine-5)-methyltransferase 1
MCGSFAVRANIMAQAKYSVLELCAGGGGMALGLEQAGFSPVVLLDNNPHACATLRRNRPYWNVIEADIRRVNLSYWRGVPLLVGGLPCTPFSTAGKQLGADDERNLFPAMLRIAEELRPRAVLIENVHGILARKFEGFRAQIDDTLRQQGFDVLLDDVERHRFWRAANPLSGVSGRIAPW